MSTKTTTYVVIGEKLPGMGSFFVYGIASWARERFDNSQKSKNVNNLERIMLMDFGGRYSSINVHGMRISFFENGLFPVFRHDHEEKQAEDGG